MPEDRMAPGLGERAALLAFAGTAAAVFALSAGWFFWWLPLLVCAPSLRWRFESFPLTVKKVAEYGLSLLLGVSVAVGVMVTLYPVIAENVTSALLRAIGWTLVGLVVVFAYGASAFRPPRTLIPAGLGLLMVAALQSRGEDPTLRMVRWVPVPAVLLFVSLIASDRTAGTSRVFAARLRRLVTLIVFAAGAAAIAVGVIRLLPWAQPFVEGAIANTLSASSPTAQTGFSAQSRLGDIEALAPSRRIVLRVWTDDPRYLRARVCVRFDGRTWSAPGSLAPVSALIESSGALPGRLADWALNVPGKDFLAEGPESLAEPGPIMTRIVQGLFGSGVVLAPANTFLARGPLSGVDRDVTGLLYARSRDDVEIYGVISRGASRPRIEEDLASPLMQACLSLPERLDPRLRALALELGHGAGSDEERLRRTIAHLHQRCRYSLKVGRFATKDPVAEFLFDKKKGYCEYFASSAALLLRLMGVPTRYVTGFSVRPANFAAGHYVVRESHAHAWIEAYLPGRGWIEADPTPPGDYDLLHDSERARWYEVAWEWAIGRIASLSAMVRRSDPTASAKWIALQTVQAIRTVLRRPVAWLLVIAAGGTLAVLARHRRRRATERRPAAVPGDLPVEIRDALRTIERLWTKAGVARPASQTPLEHARSLSDGRVSSALADAGQLVVGALYRARFGGLALTRDELDELARRLARL